MITGQIQELLRAQTFEPFCISLADGRDLEVGDRWQVAFAPSSNYHRDGLIAVAHAGHFVVVNPEQVVSVGPPKPIDPERIRRARELIGLDPDTGEPKQK
jgi:hypothetical protein